MLGFSTKRQTTLGVWLNAFDPTATEPSSNTNYTCFIHVPFRHRLLRAITTCTDIDIGDAGFSVKLMRVDDAEAPGSGEEMATFDPSATVDVIDVNEFAITGTKDCQKEDVTYCLALVGDHASDTYEMPSLIICVAPIPRAAL